MSSLVLSQKSWGSFLGLLSVISTYMRTVCQALCWMVAPRGGFSGASAENVASLFTFEGNVEPTVTLATLGTQQGIKIKVCDDTMSKDGVIVSLPENGGWVHSRCVLESNYEIYDHTADISLPTYPVGEAQFLNGGDI